MVNKVCTSKFRGGKKHLWFKQHSGEIAEYCAKYGHEATMIQFRIEKRYTLDAIIKRYNISPEQPARVLRADIDKALRLADYATIRAEQAIERQKDLERQLRELREAYSHFVETVGNRVKAGLLVPLLQRSMGELPDNLQAKPEPDALNLTGIVERMVK